MGYQALLFCPDEKTARTVTQVLSELEFNVEPCVEPFAAVKKLMGQHFDAVVVDCDNEQNATLLFKSARNSTSNQASLAVAVVEGQAGVAKAFRIGANLVLTKPINIEQAKGTLRVARGLLRKGDPSKPATAPATTAATPAPAASPTLAATPAPVAVPAKPVAAKPVPAKPAVLPTPSTVSSPRPIAPPVPKSPEPKSAPVQARPATATASSSTIAGDDDLLEISDDSIAAPAPTKSMPAPASSAVATEAKSATIGLPVAHGSGAASAPAPARVPDSHIAEKSAGHASAEDDEPLFSKPVEATKSESSHIGSAPTFTFGGANVAEPSTGGSKKIFIGIAAAVFVAAGAYFTWTKLQDSKTGQSTPSSFAVPQTTKPANAASTATKVPDSSSTATQPGGMLSSSPAKDATTPASPELSPSSSAKPSASAAPIAEKPSAPPKPPGENTPVGAALMVKGGKAPVLKLKTADTDASAPDMIGVAAGAGAPPPDLGGSTGSTPPPVLQSMNVSQGVSQGLLVKKVQPIYPKNALFMHVEGAVELQATISKNGDIARVKVLSGDSQLTRSATDAVKQWKYKPYLLNGEPVEIQTQITINFKLPN
ncbi:MAG TPA: TonB family protein [Candidatus Sulfotelmatobacter sp.]|jgi:protein TonB